MKTWIALASIVLLSVVLNWIPFVGKMVMMIKPDGIPLDSILHAIYYFLIGIFITILPWTRRKSLLYLLIALFIFSLIIEIAQAFIPGRSFSKKDIFSNSLGILTAYVIQFLVRRNKEIHDKS